MMLNKKYRHLIICHLFYPSIATELLQKLKYLDTQESCFLFNISPADSEDKKLISDAKTFFPHSLIFTIPRKGRDIGAKLMLINAALQLGIQSKTTLIIHDKNSPHVDNGSSWRNELFKIIEPKYQEKVFTLFQKNADAGIVGAAKYIQNEYSEASNSFLSSNNFQIKEQLKKYKIRTKDYSFIAGNIFWIRTDLLLRFFKDRPILKIRADLEGGNSLDFNKGTYIHAWERIMSWIATSQEFKIYGI